MDVSSLSFVARRRTAAVVAAVVTAMACRDSGAGAAAVSRYDPAFGYKDVTSVTPAEVGADVGLRVVRMFGSATGRDMLGRIGAVAVSSRLLVVYDESSCEIVMFDRASGQMTWRGGQCGSGPGDFYNVHRIVATDSTIEVFGERRVSRLDLRLREISAIEIERIVSLPHPYLTQTVVSLGGDRHLVHRMTLGRRKAKPRHVGFLEPWHLAVVSAGASTPIHAFAIDDPFTYERVEANFARYSLACIGRAEGNGRRRVHLLNAFQPLLAEFVLERDGAVSVKRGVTLPLPNTYAPFPLGGEPALWQPARGYRSLACDERSIIASWRTADSTGRTTRADALLVADSKAYRLVAARSEDAFVLTGRFAAIDGASVFVSRNLDGDFPMVVEAELLRPRTP